MSNTLKPLEVKTGNIASYAVTESKLAPDSVTTSKIKDGAVKSAKIGDKQVTGDKIADRSISTAKIIDGAITGSKIADGSITGDKISNGVLGRPLTPPVATVEIANNAVSEAKLQNNSVTTDKVKDGAITNAKIAANTITGAKIAANAVGSSELAPNSVGYSEIKSQSLEPRSIKTLSGLPPTPGQVPVYDETQGNLWWFRWANAATRPLTPPLASGEIANGAVGNSQLAADSVITEKIQNGAVTQEKLAPGVGGGDVLTMFPAPVTALDLGGITATTAPATVDLSAIIPVGTKGVIVSIACINQSYANGGMMVYIFQQAGAEYALQVMAPPVNAPGVSNGGSVLMPVATDRTLLWQAYVSGNNSTELVIYILGYVV